MRPIHAACLLSIALSTIAIGNAARAADPANDEARRCASVYGRVMEVSGEGSSPYNAALQGRLRLLNQIEKNEGHFDGPSILASDEAVTAKYKQAPAGLRAAVAGCDRAFGQTVASGLAQPDAPYVPPSPQSPPAVAVAPPSSTPAQSHAEMCEELDYKAANLMRTWTFRRQEIAEDPYDDKLRRLRDSYDTLHEKLEWVRDDASDKGCPKLAREISQVFTTWERP